MMIREGSARYDLCPMDRQMAKKKSTRHVCKREASFARFWSLCAIIVMIIYLCFPPSRLLTSSTSQNRALIAFLAPHFPHNVLVETTNRHSAPKHYQFLFGALCHPREQWSSWKFHGNFSGFLRLCGNFIVSPRARVICLVS